MVAKWGFGCIMVIAVMMGSCAASMHYDNTKYKIAQLECQQSEVEDEQ